MIVGGIVAIRGGLRTPGDFVGGLAVQGGEFAVGKGEEVHAESFGLGSLALRLVSRRLGRSDRFTYLAFPTIEGRSLCVAVVGPLWLD